MIPPDFHSAGLEFIRKHGQCFDLPVIEKAIKHGYLMAVDEFQDQIRREIRHQQVIRQRNILPDSGLTKTVELPK